MRKSAPFRLTLCHGLRRGRGRASRLDLPAARCALFIGASTHCRPLAGRLARGGDALRQRAQVAVEDAHRQPGPIVGEARLGVPVGDDDAAVQIGRRERRKDRVSSAASTV